MMCQRIGRPPISIIGFGRKCDSSEIRVPRPPARMTAFMDAYMDSFAWLATPAGRKRQDKSRGCAARIARRARRRASARAALGIRGLHAQQIEGDRRRRDGRRFTLAARHDAAIAPLLAL